jgi:hypothetical protein
LCSQGSTAWEAVDFNGDGREASLLDYSNSAI